MKERPILFSGPMVRAILDGSKTQTRRVVKNQPAGQCIGPVAVRAVSDGFQWFGAAGESSVFACPYGQPGERLWVRETWRTDDGLNDQAPSSFSAWPVKYKADGHVLKHGSFFGNTNGKTRVSIHMPRWASRILLEITGVRVERLNDISEADAIAEGTKPYLLPVNQARKGLRHVDGYAQLWESINGPGSWDANPWVWAIEFKVLEGGAA